MKTLKFLLILICLNSCSSDESDEKLEAINSFPLGIYYYDEPNQNVARSSIWFYEKESKFYEEGKLLCRLYIRGMITWNTLPGGSRMTYGVYAIAHLDTKNNIVTISDLEYKYFTLAFQFVEYPDRYELQSLGGFTNTEEYNLTYVKEMILIKLKE